MNGRILNTVFIHELKTFLLKCNFGYEKCILSIEYLLEMQSKNAY